MEIQATFVLFRMKPDAIDTIPKMLSDPETWTKWQELGSDINQKWPVFAALIISNCWRDELQMSRDGVLGYSSLIEYYAIDYANDTWNVIRPERLDGVTRWRPY